MPVDHLLVCLHISQQCQVRDRRTLAEAFTWNALAVRVRQNNSLKILGGVIDRLA